MAKKPVKDQEAPPEAALYAIRKQMSDLRVVEKKLARQVLDGLLMKGKRRGDYFIVTPKQTLKISDPELAFQWAAQHNCIDVNTVKAMSIIRREFTVPAGFDIQKTDYLRMAGQNETNSGDDS